MPYESESVGFLLQNRSFVYSCLGRVFGAALDDESLRLLLDPHTVDECSLLDGEGECGAQLLITSLEGVSSESLDMLQKEYLRLFVGPDQIAVLPWESVYVCGEELLFQESTLSVRKAYLSAGFRAAGYPHEPDDHIATELSFMAELSDRAKSLFESGDIGQYKKTLLAQQAFLKDHLLVWIREFSDRLNEVDGISSFYPSFASLAALVCERDAEVIEELLAAA